MQIEEKVVVVTGGGHGIGAAMCRQFAAEGADRVIVSDIDEDAAAAVAEEIGGIANTCDVSSERDVQALVQQTIQQCGRIDILCSNAGITTKGGIETPDDDWQWLWDVNVMSRVYAARAVIPHMLNRGSGCIVHTASGAGLLTEIGSAAYSVTKHADVAFAEWLAVRYGREGIEVSCVCPLGVATDFLDHDDPIHQFLHATSVLPEDVAHCVIDGIRGQRFMILPHPEVEEFFAWKTQDYDKWISGMQRMRQKLTRAKKKKKAA